MERPKKGLIKKTLERCRSIGSAKKPKGCMTVCVGPHKERFIVRTECVNHPLFQELLEEAQMECGYAHDGPIELPCDVEHFDRVLWEMDEDAAAAAAATSMPLYLCSLPASPGRGLTRSWSGYRVLTPSAPGRMSVR